MIERLKAIISILKGESIVVMKEDADNVGVVVGNRLRDNKSFIINSLGSTLKTIKEVY